MTIADHLTRAKVELSDAYQALEAAQRAMHEAQERLRQCELQKIAAEATVQAYARVTQDEA